MLEYLAALQAHGSHNPISSNDVAAAIKDLKTEHSPGKDGLVAEHFKFVHPTIFLYLSYLFNSILVYNYLPQKFMDTVLVPILISYKHDVSDLNSYRPISITCVIYKIFELVFVVKCCNCLQTIDNQFEF